MSAASERARALLAAATQDAWRANGKDLRIHNRWWTMPPADAALIAEACSPEGGLLATLAAEVESLTRLLAAAADTRATIFEDAAHLEAENARLWAALQEAMDTLSMVLVPHDLVLAKVRIDAALAGRDAT